ncbi:MAG: ATP-binding protein [Candidatus Erginobacter occultus]|nr:ATP-binding protein [Candidatus Erginobacter occultus]
MRLRYQHSLYLSFLLIVVIPILAAFLLFKIFLKTAAESEFHAQAKKVARGISAEIDRRSTNLLALAGTFARNPRIISALEDGDRKLLENRLADLLPYSELDLLEGGGRQGVVLSRAHRPGEWGENKSGQTVIQNALRGLPGADIERGASGIALRAVAPVISRQGEIIGTIMTGVLLDDTFFETYKTITGFEIALFGGESLIAATSREPPSWTPGRPASSGDGGGDGESVSFLEEGDESWGCYIPIFHSAGEAFGGLLVWQTTRAIMRPLQLNRLTLTVTFVISLLLGVLLALFLSRNFSSPLKQMLPIMDQVSGGELQVGIPDFSWVEFQELAGHFRDMLAKLRKYREKVARTQQQLLFAGKMAVLGKVTAELAHEIRNPLNSIEINLRLLTDDLQAAGKPAGQKIERLCSEVSRLKQTVTDFVQAGGRITLNKEALNLAGEIRAILELARPQIELLGIRLQTDLRDLPPVAVDRNRFHQIIFNIILNACQSMGPEGILSIDNEEYGDNQMVIIRDTGGGISPEEKEEIFDFPFTTKADGTGCGLAYVLRVVQAHHGEFDLDSEPGAGTEVRISFPRQETEGTDG